PLLSARRPALPARLPAFPRAVVLILIVGIAQAAALVLHWAPPTPAQGQQRRIPTHPLRPTRRFDQRRWGIATAATRVASSRVGSRAVGWHALALGVGLGRGCRARAHQGTAAPSALSSPVHLHLPPQALPPWGLMRERREAAPLPSPTPPSPVDSPSPAAERLP